MTEEQNYSSDNIHQKLPSQHWILRYSSLWVLGLMALLLVGLSWIQIPVVVNLELHPAQGTPYFKATTAATGWSIAQEQTLLIQLENGRKATFQVAQQEQAGGQHYLLLQPLALHPQDSAFLASAYISIGKVQKETQPLIQSIFSASPNQ